MIQLFNGRFWEFFQEKKWKVDMTPTSSRVGRRETRDHALIRLKEANK